MNKILEEALRIADLGYKVFPMVPNMLPNEKKPRIKDWQEKSTCDEETIYGWWDQWPDANLGLNTEGLIVLDIDQKNGEKNKWFSSLRDKDFSCDGVSQTWSGGIHYIWKQPGWGSWKNTVGLIAEKVDTRADGGLIVVPPTQILDKKYQWLIDLDTPFDKLTVAPDWLLQILVSISQEKKTSKPVSITSKVIPDGQRHNTLFRIGAKLRHDGYTQEEIKGMLFVINKARCQPPGDESHIERNIVPAVMKYEPDQVTEAFIDNQWSENGVNWNMKAPKVEVFDDLEEELEKDPEDPGIFPKEKLRIPGFISELMDFCLETAPYPNETLAFVGALAMQSYLGGRKVKDQEQNRSNLYLLALAPSGIGKEHPRAINTELLIKINSLAHLGDEIASGEGIQDAMYLNQKMLWMPDEFDGVLRAIKHSKEARYDKIMNTLLKFYGASKSAFKMRPKAGLCSTENSNSFILQPSLTLLATAIPSHFYNSLSENMLTNGLFNRFLSFETVDKHEGQDAKDFSCIPDRIVETATFWNSIKGVGNLESYAQSQVDCMTIPRTKEAQYVLHEIRKDISKICQKAIDKQDDEENSIWARSLENIKKLSLVYALSENYQKPEISVQGVTWSCDLVLHQVKRMVYMAKSSVFSNEFHELALKATKKIKESKGKRISRSVLLKRMKCDAMTLTKIINTLELSGDIQILSGNNKIGRPEQVYFYVR